MLTVLREVLAGEVVAPDAMLSASVSDVLRHKPVGAQSKPSDFGLSKRQAEVLGMMARGKSIRDIAALLGLTEGTVKIHLTAIFKVRQFPAGRRRWWWSRAAVSGFSVDSSRAVFAGYRRSR